MKRETGRYKAFTRRAAFVGGGQLLLISALVGRLYYLQVVRSDQYRMLAEENRISLRLLAPPRGVITDRRGVVLAGNSQNYRVLLIPEQTREPGERGNSSVARTLDQLAQLVPIDEFERQHILREVGRRREFVPVTVAENLTWEEFSRINVHSPDLRGVVPDVGETRYYPLAEVLGHVVGYVAPVVENDLDGDPLLELPGFRIGRSGVERLADLDLRGKSGSSQVEVNAHGRVIRELERTEGQQGRDVALTIDAGLQQFVTKAIGEESAGAAVLDVKSGDVLALVSTPLFDPNNFAVGMSQAQWAALIANPRKPLLNKAVAGQYPPGSTFKMIVALAALEAGVANSAHRVVCTGELQLGDRKFHCWREHGHGAMTMLQALEQSCDVFFYDLALRTGIDRISAMAKRFGLGEAIDLGLGTERAGLMPTRDWKLAFTGEPWQAGETLITGIGQGFVLSTPLQLALMTAEIANGGMRVTPRLILPTEPEDPVAALEPDEFDPVADPRSLGISAQSLAVVQEGMNRVVNDPAGTAFRARITTPGMEMAGKTGTSQVRSISAAEREEGVQPGNLRPWEQRDHAVFVGYAPLHDPRFAVAVVVEHGGSGAGMAAPIARDILLDVQRRAANTAGGLAAAAASPREG